MVKKRKILFIANSNNEPAKLIKQWLVHYNADFVSVDSNKELFNIVSFELNTESFKFIIGNKTYNSSEFDKVYFHVGALRTDKRLGVRVNRGKFSDVNNAFGYYLTGYEKTIWELNNIAFGQKNTIGKDNGGRVNKIEMLTKALEVGFKIPETLLTTKKSELIGFKNRHGNIICKSLDLNLFFEDERKDKMIHNLTSSVEEIHQLPETFPLSIFQKNIDKFIELRVFCLEDVIHAAAIFSQTTENTLQDYRNYDLDNPNRVVPYTLPEDIIIKIKEFQRITGLKTGSIDLILNEEGNYFFLEINPQGQFIGISNYCNYNLEKVVAQNLINHYE